MTESDDIELVVTENPDCPLLVRYKGEEIPVLPGERPEDALRRHLQAEGGQ